MLPLVHLGNPHSLTTDTEMSRPSADRSHNCSVDLQAADLQALADGVHASALE